MASKKSSGAAPVLCCLLLLVALMLPSEALLEVPTTLVIRYCKYPSEYYQGPLPDLCAKGCHDAGYPYWDIHGDACSCVKPCPEP